MKTSDLGQSCISIDSTNYNAAFRIFFEQAIVMLSLQEASAVYNPQLQKVNPQCKTFTSDVKAVGRYCLETTVAVG